MNGRRHGIGRAAVVACLVLTACSSDGPGTSNNARPDTSGRDTAATVAADTAIALVTYDSFPTADTSLNDALAEFTASTGIGVTIVVAGDAGTMVSKAELTSGDPEGDVMFGVDNTLLSRALRADVFSPYETTELASLDPRLVALAPDHAVTPVDFGDVCVNYDVDWFEQRDLAPPQTLADLTNSEYRDLLVVEDPGTSSPGLAFLLATIAEFGGDGWQEFWRDLRGNGVEVVDSWTTAYYDRFSGSGGGDRPLVVSYGTSPAAEVVFADPPRDDAPTAAVPATCFRQVEFAGVLRGTSNEQAARQLVDFLAGRRFQQEIALNLFVHPARTDVQLPQEFTAFGVAPEDPYTVAPEEITENRERWVDEWTQIVVR